MNKNNFSTSADAPKTALKKPLKVAYLLEFSSLNGGERSLLNFLQHLSKSDLSPVVFAPSTGDVADRLATLNLTHSPFEMRDLGRRKNFEDVAIELAPQLNDLEIDILHANSLSASEYSGLAVEYANQNRAKCQPRIVSIGHVRDIQRLKKSRVARLNRNDKIIAVSEATRQNLVKWGVEEQRTITIFNGIQSDWSDRAEFADEIWSQRAKSNERWLLNIGQICLRKAQNVCLEGAAPVLRENPDCHLLIIGERYSNKDESIQFENNLHSFAKSQNIDSQVHFLGNRVDVPAFMNRATALLHSAHQEPLGRVLLESLVAGLPTIATRVGGTEEIFEHEKNGLLIDKDSPEQLTTELTRLINNESLQQSLSKAAKTNGSTRFTPQRHRHKVTQLYQQLTQQDYSSGCIEQP